MRTGAFSLHATKGGKILPPDGLVCRSVADRRGRPGGPYRLLLGTVLDLPNWASRPSDAGLQEFPSDPTTIRVAGRSAGSPQNSLCEGDFAPALGRAKPVTSSLGSNLAFEFTEVRRLRRRTACIQDQRVAALSELCSKKCSKNVELVGARRPAQAGHTRQRRLPIGPPGRPSTGTDHTPLRNRVSEPRPKPA